MGCGASAAVAESADSKQNQPTTVELAVVAEGTEEDIAGRFALLDVDRTGFLDRKAVARLVQNLRLASSPHVRHSDPEYETLRVSDADVDAAMTVLDTNKNGLVEFDEFRAWWKSTGGVL
jgi:Ca2+-binding EF-hand superfamily protein